MKKLHDYRKKPLNSGPSSFLPLISTVTTIQTIVVMRRRSMESEDDEETEVDGSGNPEEWSTVIRKLEAQINDLETCTELIQKHWKALCKPLNELESNNGDIEMCQGKTKEVGERATLFRISTNAMVNVSEFLMW